MESQTTYYIGNQPNVQQGLQAVKGGTYIQPSTGAQDSLQTVYYPQGTQPQVVQYQPQPQNQAQSQYQSHPQTQSQPQYQPQQIYQPQQFQPQSTNQQSAVYYSPQSQPQTSQNYYQAQPVQPAQTSQQVYTIGASPHRQIQSQPQYQNMAQRQPQQAPQSQQLFFSPSQQSPQRVVYASSTQGQSGVTPQYQPVQQAASPTRVVQYSPQTSYQPKQEPIIQPQISVRPVASQPGQQVSYQPQQTMYAAPTQPQVIRMNQNPQQSYVQNVSPIDRGAYQTPTVANQQTGSYQPMGKAVPVTMATPPQQYQPPQQQPSLSQSVPAQQLQQQRPIPQAQPRPQPPPTSPTGATPKFRQLQPRRSMDRGYNNAPPQFVQQPAGQVTVNEGDSIILKAVVKPAGDPTLDVQWLKNGVVLSASSRHNAVLDRGYAEFQFLYTNTTDSGEYVCVAKTANGTAQSSPCQVTIVPEDSVITDSQLPEESMIMNLAAMENQLAMNGTSRREDEVKFTTPPQFLRPLLPQINLKENERAKFETFVQPSNDPSMTVEWFKDGEPLKTGCRFTETMDRGYVILDIHYTYPEDSGQYYCVAKNNAGSTPSNVVDLTCKGGTGIVTDSVLSAESVHYLQSLDTLETSTLQDQRYTETEQQPAAPTFELEPKNTTAIEGSPLRLLVKAGGYPPPRVQWLINGDILPTSGGGGAWRIYNDGGISYLEFNRCGPPGEYTVTAVAKNNLGEAHAECSLVIDPQPDFRPDLKHVAPENPFRRMASLKRVERTDELKHAFEKTKPKVLELHKLERRNSQTEGLNDTEQLYAQVQASLRSNRRSITGDPARTAQPPVPRPPQQPQPLQQPKPQPPPQKSMASPAQQPVVMQQQMQPQLQQQMPQAAPVQQLQPQVQEFQQAPATQNATEGQPNGQYSVTETSAEFQIEL
ncbi:unnamed protein product [Hymenolepis diminuta]|uniref:Ig-like domain-containing protein n=1 Tax=Hymenolepis diminuta TaxID=6216 RepID=A0A564Y1U5_HYMDI|nr:unnamed protein product [Hymenolepis diminuta]